MLASALIAMLREMVDEFGDLPVRGSWYDQKPGHNGAVTWLVLDDRNEDDQFFDIDGSQP